MGVGVLDTDESPLRPGLFTDLVQTEPCRAAVCHLYYRSSTVGAMPRNLSGSCEPVEADRRGFLVADAGWFAGLFEPVVAVPDAFDSAGTSAHSVLPVPCCSSLVSDCSMIRARSAAWAHKLRRHTGGRRRRYLRGSPLRATPSKSIKITEHRVAVTVEVLWEPYSKQFEGGGSARAWG